MNPNVPIDLKVPRTINDARSVASEIVHPALRESADRAIAEAESTAEMIGKQRVEELRARVTREGKSAHDRNAEIVADSRAFTDAMRSGRLSIADARKHLHKLRTGHTLTRTQGDLIDRDTEQADAIEADPIEFADDLYRKYPTTRPTFPF